MEVYVGVDWAVDSAVCTIGTRDSYQRCEISAHPQEVNELLAEAHQLVPNAQVVRVAIEAGSPLWFRLFSQTNAFVHVVDGKQAKRFVESMSPGGAKDDNRDSFSMFQMAMSPEHRGEAQTLSSDVLSSLEQLSLIHERWIGAKTAEIQRLRQQLANTMPSLSQALSSLDKNFALNFLQKYPTPKKVCSLTKRGFNTFVKKNRLREKTRKKLWTAIEQCFDLQREEEAQVQALVVRQLVSRIRSIQSSLEEVEEKMQGLYEESEGADILSSIKGVGLHLGSTLLAQVFVDPREKRDSAAIRVGAAPLTIQSGKTKGGRGKKQEQKKQVRMRKTVPSRLRRFTYLLGLQAIRWHDWAKAQYNAMRARGKNAATAFRAVARSLLRIIQALLKNGSQFDRDKYVGKLKEKGVSWAMSLPSTIEG